MAHDAYIKDIGWFMKPAVRRVAEVEETALAIIFLPLQLLKQLYKLHVRTSLNSCLHNFMPQGSVSSVLDRWLTLGKWLTWVG